MDLLSTVRKQGSRGGRNEFSWDDVKSSTHRENYLGHSVMAPVGRWQSGRDLGWYAKKDGEPEKTEAEIIAEEKRMIKEQENELLKQKFGGIALPTSADNANLTALGPRKDDRSEDKSDRREHRKSHREHRRHGDHRPRSRSRSRDRSRDGASRRHRDERQDRYRDGHDRERHRGSRRHRSRSRSGSKELQRREDRAGERRRRDSNESGGYQKALPRRHRDSRDEEGTFERYRRERDSHREDRRRVQDQDTHFGRYRRRDSPEPRHEKRQDNGRRRSRSPSGR